MFARKLMGVFSHAHKDVLYDTLKREDINWRALNLQVAKQVYEQHELENVGHDDSIKTRRGKRIEAISSHFDHVSNTHVMSQQVLTLGLVTDKAFLPLDSQIFVSDTKAHPLSKPYADGRSVGAKRYQEAIGQSKVEMAAGMMRVALSLDLTAILRMKRNKLKYRVKIGENIQELDATQIYQLVIHANNERRCAACLGKL